MSSDPTDLAWRLPPSVEVATCNEKCPGCVSMRARLARAPKKPGDK